MGELDRDVHSEFDGGASGARWDREWGARRRPPGNATDVP
jgi:hypothetical protein